MALSDDFIPMPVGDDYDEEPAWPLQKPRGEGKGRRGRRGKGHPPYVATPQQLQFWTENVVTSMSKVRALASSASSVFVALDFEGSANSRGGYTCIGMATARTRPGQALSEVPCISKSVPWPGVDLDDAVDFYGIEAWSGNIGHKGRSKHKAEEFRYGATDNLSPKEVDRYIESILEICTRDGHKTRGNSTALCSPRHLYTPTGSHNSESPGSPGSSDFPDSTTHSPQKDIVIVTWGIHAEFQAMLAFHPQLTDKVKAWVDLCEATSLKLAGESSTRRFSLHNYLLTMGMAHNEHTSQFSFCKDPDKFFRHRLHDPGMDCVRTMAALLATLAAPPWDGGNDNKGAAVAVSDGPRRGSTVTVTIGGSTLVYHDWKSTELDKAFRKSCRLPSVAEAPLGCVVVEPDSDMELLPSDIRRPQDMRTFVESHFDHFPDAGSAFGRWQSRKSCRRMTHGWVAFADVERMRGLVQQLDGQTVGGIKLRLTYRVADADKTRL